MTTIRGLITNAEARLRRRVRALEADRDFWKKLADGHADTLGELRAELAEQVWRTDADAERADRAEAELADLKEREIPAWLRMEKSWYAECDALKARVAELERVKAYEPSKGGGRESAEARR